ncbi:MAG: VOC family protein [Gammaproteobacteria bacterium]|nr:VOC family protein [Gammaproteobacteria bacterium]
MKPILFVATSKPDESRVFYQSVLGLTLKEDQPFALVFEFGGHQLRVQKVEATTVQPYTSAGWEVDDIEQAVNNLADKGVVTEKYPFLEQDENGIWTTPDGAKIAWFKDPDENLLSFTQAPS